MYDILADIVAGGKFEAFCLGEKNDSYEGPRYRTCGLLIAGAI
jgi:hypothetical protein